MAKTVKFPAQYDDALYQGVVLQFAPSVAVRQAWSDPWIDWPALYPLEVTWSVSPTLPVAVLEYDYGLIRQSHRTVDDEGNETLGFQEVSKAFAKTLPGWFVRITCPTLYSENLPLESARYWYGVIEEVHDEQGGVEEVYDEQGVATGRCYGRLTLVAYGLEKLLSDHQVLNSQCEGFIEVGVPFDFNRAGPKGVEGNRAAGDAVFGTTPSTAERWDSRQIVDYLLTHQVPKDQAGNQKLNWLLHADSLVYVSNDDAPLLKSDSATTYSLLSQLIDRRRGVMWWCVVDPENEEWIYVKANSINAVDVKGNKLTMPANSNQVNIEYDADSLTNVVINSSDLPRYHQVIVQGPRIRCVGTFSNESGTLEAAWEDDDQTTYDAGGTPHPDNTPLKTKQVRNDAVRRAPKLSKVYSLFRVPQDWNFEVGNGDPLFISAENEPQEQNYLELSIDQTMPILEGQDYEGTRIRAGQVALPTLNEQEMRPLCFFRRPYKNVEPYKYQIAEGVVAGVENTDIKENERIQCFLSVPQGTMTIRLDTQGQPQHSIAFADFTPIIGEDRAVGQVDWRQAVFTFSLTSQFHTEAKWPDPPATSDVVRRKVIYAGDQYYQHYVAPNTVVGIDKDGYLVLSDGGWIPTVSSPEDPLPLLEDIAKIAASWYIVQHYVLTLESCRLKPNSDLALGALILQAGGGVKDHDGHKMTVNAPITQIKFSYPRGTGEKCPAARMQVKTWAGELDAVEFVAVKLPDSPLTRRSKPVASKLGLH